jgi:hypothetical protein
VSAYYATNLPWLSAGGTRVTAPSPAALEARWAAAAEDALLAEVAALIEDGWAHADACRKVFHEQGADHK